MSNIKYKDWDFYKASQVIPLALNDPNSIRPQDFFTVEWGDAFVYNSPLPDPIEPVHDISLAEFQPYLAYTSKLQHRIANNTRQKPQKDLQLRNGLKKESTTTNEAEFSRIPRYFFSSQFKLYNLETFQEVIPWNIFNTSSSNRVWSLIKRSTKRNEGCAHLLRTQLTHYLDVIETKLAYHVSIKSDEFFKILDSQEKLLKDIRDISYSTRSFRHALNTTCEVTIANKLLVFTQLRKKRRLEGICEKLKIMSLVHETLTTIQAQQITHDHVASLDLIGTAKDSLKSDLSGLHCFRHLSLILSNMGGVIEDKLEGEFTKLFFETVSLFGISDDSTIIDTDFEEQVAIMIARLSKQNRIHFLIPLREAIPDVMRSKFQQCLKKEMGSDAELEEVKLSELIQLLPYEEWVHLLSQIFNHLIKLTEKISYIFKIISSSSAALNPATRRGSVSGEYKRTQSPTHTKTNLELQLEDTQIDFMNDSQLDLRIQNLVAASSDVINSDDCNIPTDFTTVDTECSLTKEQVQAIHIQCMRLLETATDVLHLRCSYLVGLRAKSGQFEKLTSQEFFTLAQTLESFITHSQNITKCNCPHLRSVLLSHSKKFLEQFHEERMKKLSILLEQEQWIQQEVPSAIQLRINQLQEGLIGDRSPTHVDASLEQTHPTLTLNNKSYPVVFTLLILLNMIIDYCYCLQDIPLLVTDILTKLVKLIESFNTKSCHLVLGAGGLHAMGLKNISSRHLALVQRCLEALLVVLPLAEQCFYNKLTEKQKLLLNQFERTRIAIQKHQEQINIKIIEIMDETFRKHLNNWEVCVEQPSSAIKSVTKQMSTLYKVIYTIFTPDQIETLFIEVIIAFTKRFSNRLSKLSKSKVNLEEHVIQNELTYVHGAISTLHHLGNLDLEYFQVTFI
ncbi:hypothetical protein LOD99_3205 [Oopsacas minuta]|uniref:Vacuolar protein sorting-associated protein 54 n=1 Tax=Oopsacas minuta TaxID=111878 RepID=A0AAV7JYF0_9METZ|nr:hypothetical protein LOD99_3205 [Oopsacas minuta]